jgi:uncharacterized membrane protein
VIIFDIVHLITDGAQWAVVSYWLIPAGVLTGVIAAVFGFLDWTKIPTDTRAKRVGALHGVGNVVVVTLFILSWFVRGGADASPGLLALLLSVAGGGLSMLTGWLGGELVDRLSVGVDDGAHLNAPGSLSGRPAGENRSTAPGRA